MCLRCAPGARAHGAGGRRSSASSARLPTGLAWPMIPSSSLPRITAVWRGDSHGGIFDKVRTWSRTTGPPALRGRQIPPKLVALTCVTNMDLVPEVLAAADATRRPRTDGPPAPRRVPVVTPWRFDFSARHGQARQLPPIACAAREFKYVAHLVTSRIIRSGGTRTSCATSPATPHRAKNCAPCATGCSAGWTHTRYRRASATPNASGSWVPRRVSAKSRPPCSTPSGSSCLGWVPRSSQDEIGDSLQIRPRLAASSASSPPTHAPALPVPNFPALPIYSPFSVAGQKVLRASTIPRDQVSMQWSPGHSR